MRRVIAFLSPFFLSYSLPLWALAHEVYVLTPSEISNGVTGVSLNPFSAFADNLSDFFTFGTVTIVLVAIVILLSFTRSIEEKTDSFLRSIKHYAPFVARVTVGSCFLACGYFGALFGPELPFASFGLPITTSLVPVFYLLGMCFLIGIFARAAAATGLLIFLGGVFFYGSYMFTYLNYFGELSAILILGSGAWSVDTLIQKKGSNHSGRSSRFAPYAFLFLRICFGLSIIYTAYYAKYLHSALALETVQKYRIADIFHLDPLFIVLGALLIEGGIGLFFIIGFEIRFVAITFLAFLSVSLLFFGEVIWPHLVLIGLNIAMIAHGYDRYTFGEFLGRKTHLEPVL